MFVMFDLVFVFFFYHFMFTYSSVPDFRQLDVFNEIIQAVLVFVLIISAFSCLRLIKHARTQIVLFNSNT